MHVKIAKSSNNCNKNLRKFHLIYFHVRQSVNCTETTNLIQNYETTKERN